MRLLAIMIAVVVLVSGCGVMGPNWSRPGTLTEQQNRAVINYPYADNNLGPTVDGVIPREFSAPQSEVDRQRAWRDERDRNGF